MVASFLLHEEKREGLAFLYKEANPSPNKESPKPSKDEVLWLILETPLIQSGLGIGQLLCVGPRL